MFVVVVGTGFSVYAGGSGGDISHHRLRGDQILQGGHSQPRHAGIVHVCLKILMTPS